LGRKMVAASAGQILSNVAKYKNEREKVLKNKIL